jgi:hypothetical protein
LTTKLQTIISEYLQTYYLKIEEFVQINDIGIDVELKPAESLPVEQGDVPPPVIPPAVEPDVAPPIFRPTEEPVEMPPPVIQELKDVPPPVVHDPPPPMIHEPRTPVIHKPSIPSMPKKVLPGVVSRITSMLGRYVIVGKTHLQKLEIHAGDIQTGKVIEHVVHNLNLFITKQWEEYTIAWKKHESIATSPGIAMVHTSTNYKKTEFEASFGPPEFQITDSDTVIVLIKIKELRIFKDSTRR